MYTSPLRLLNTLLGCRKAYFLSGAFGLSLLILYPVVAQGQSSEYTYAKLLDFGGDIPGVAPSAALIADGQGNLYGTTYRGGANGDGTPLCQYRVRHSPIGCHFT